MAFVNQAPLGPDRTLRIDRFAGLNMVDPPVSMGDNELQVAQNVDLTPSGALSKRTGFIAINTDGSINTIRVIGQFRTATLNQVIFKDGNNLRYWDATGSHLIGVFNNVEWGVQYLDKFFMVRNNDVMVQWDGATATTIAGSPSGTINIVHRDRMFVANTVGANPSRLFYSNVADFSTAGWNALGTFLDINVGDGDVITGMTILHDNFLIFKIRSCWYLNVVADVTAWSVRNADPRIGCISKYTVQQFEGFAYFVSSSAVYRTDGYTFTDISQKISPVFVQQEATIAGVNRSTAGIWQGRYIIRLVTRGRGDGADTIRYFVFYFEIGGWTEWVIADATFKAFNFLAVDGADNIRGLYVGSGITNGSSDGTLYRYGTPSFIGDPASPGTMENWEIDRLVTDYSDGVNVSRIRVSIQTKDFDCGAPGIVKRMKPIHVDSQGSPAAIIVYYDQNPVGFIPNPSKVIADDFRHTVRYGPLGMFTSVIVEVEDTTAVMFLLYSVTLNYRVLGKTLLHS